MSPDYCEMRSREVVFLLGPAGSGKTRRCLERLTDSEAAGQPAIYLVPEQSTYLADRQLLEPPRPVAIRHVRVLSFRRLAYLLEGHPAGSTPRSLDPSGRRILLRMLFAQLDGALRAPFASILDRPGFLESLVTILRELRFEAGPDPQSALIDPARAGDLPGDLSAKLRTLAALRSAYDGTLAARGLRDPELVLLETPARVRAQAEMFRGVPVLVDGFLSFTRLESEILVALTDAGASLTICLCVDPKLAELLAELRVGPPSFRLRQWPNGLLARIRRSVFLGTLRTLAELKSRFEAAGLVTQIHELPETESPPRFHSRDLAQIESSLLTRSQNEPGAPTDVEMIAARDPSHEVEVWARTVDHWIRLDKDATPPNDSPVRPGDIAVIVRDLEMYRPLVEETFRRFNIPVFIDQHWDIAARPLVRTILDALEVLRTGWQREAVIGFFRSPLLGARGGEVDLLENLSLEGGYDYDRWTGDAWPMLQRPPRTRYIRGEADPADAALEPEAEETEDERIEQVRTRIANRLRATYLDPLKRLEAAWKAGAITGAEGVAALRSYLETSGIYGRAGPDPDKDGADGRRAQGTPTKSDATREREAVDHVLDQIAEEATVEPLSLDAFARLLHAGLGSLRLGRTPTGLDRVTLAEVQRSRLGEVRRAILGGLSARDFPRAVQSARFFNERERAKLAELGLDLGTPDPMRQEEEAYFLYVALTRASERLLLTRPTTDLEGNSLEPSPFVKEIQNALPGLQERTPQVEEEPSDLHEVQTTEELAARVGAYIASRLDRRRSGRHPEPASPKAEADDHRILTAYNRLLALETAVPSRGHALLAPSRRLWGYSNHPVLSPQLLNAAFRGRPLRTSAGRLESFARCPYQHFARHMLRLEPRPQAEITPLENGLLAHRALEVLYRQGPPPPDTREIEQRLRRVFDEIAGEERLRAYQVDPSGHFLWRNTRGRLRRFLELEAKRLIGSPFQPHAFEQEFGFPPVDPLRITLPQGMTVLLRGRIDRIDVARVGDALEAIVLDYKSNEPRQRGRPQDVDRGLDLQLAVYLLVVEEVLGMDAVGGLYAQALPTPRSKLSTDPANPLGIKLIGLVPEDQRARVTGRLRVPRGAKEKLRDRADLRALLERARATMALYAGALLRGHIDVAPVKISGQLPCRYCEFGALCRVDEAYNPPRSSPREGIEETGLRG